MLWHVAPGDAVAADQVLVDVQTDKAVVEIPAPVAGTVTALGGDVGAMVPVGAMLAVIATEAKAPAKTAPETPPSETRPETPPPGKGPARRALASPATRKLARELGVDLATVQGSGNRGQITKDDVTRAAAAPPPAPAAEPKAAPAPVSVPAPSGEDRVEPLRGLRRRIAQTMEAAWREIPHILTFHELDAANLVAARRALVAEFEPHGVKPGYLPLIMKACAAALRQHPRFNAALDMAAEQITYRHRINIGFATATPDGLIVPVIHDADRKSLLTLAQEIDRLAGAARTRRIRVEDLQGGTFTISNYGSYGGHFGTPIIRPPEVAIAGVGAVRERVVPVDGAPAVRPSLPLVVSTDHRLNDGEHLGEFAGKLGRYLVDPVRLLGHA